MKEFTFLASFTYPHEYAVLRLVFDQEGIRYLLRNDTLVGLLPFYSYALGGIDLLVHLNDFEKAKKIFDRFNEDPNHLRIV